MVGSLPYLLVHCAMVYAAIGVVVALAFLMIGIDRVAPLARGAYAFRPLLVPGLVLLWPLVAIRWIAVAKS